MKITKFMEKIKYLKDRQIELAQALEEMSICLDNTEEEGSLPEQHMHLQVLMNAVVEIRRSANKLNQKIPDIQEDIRDLMEELEDRATLAE